MTSLRASGVDLHVDVAEQLPSVVRQLQGVSNVTASQQENDQSNVWYDHELFMMFTTATVALIVLCNLACLWYRVRRWCKPEEAENSAPPTVDVSGRVFDLTPGQRRAVLEAIFSETSKEVTEKDVVISRKEKRKQRKSSNQTNVHVTISVVDSVNDHVIAERESDHDIEEGVVGAYLSEVSPVPPVSDPTHLELTVLSTSAPVQNEDQNSDGQLPSSSGLSALEKKSVTKRKAVEDPISIAQTSLSTETTNDDIGVARGPLPIRDEDEREDSSPIFRRFPTDLAVPDLREKDSGFPRPAFAAAVASVEETIEDEEDRKPHAKPTNLSEAESIGSSNASEFDDETDENVCPICLNSYDEGDEVIASKHCSHLFHKSCVLEWLQKHDSCPVCRVDMVTEGELNQAATAIIGRTRMYVAVESMACNSGHGARNAGARRHVLPAHRHVLAAPLTPPHSPSHRNSRLICVTVNVPQLTAAQRESRAARGRISFY